MTIDLNEERARRKGEYTVKKLLENCTERSEDFDTVIILTKGKNGELDYFYSTSYATERIGTIEMLKQQMIIDQLFDEQ